MAAREISRPDVYDAREIARAAGRPLAVITALLDSGRVSTVDGEYVSHAEALRMLRALKSGRPLDVAVSPATLFARRHGSRETRVPLAASTAIHAVLAGLGLLVAVLGRAEVTEALATAHVEPVRLVFLATPGPGGGGGGGGLRHATPPEAARRAGRESLTSPVPPPEPAPKPRPEIPAEPAETPPVAPVASVAADKTSQTGVIEETTAASSKGPGRDGAAGAGEGGGIGVGQGAGIGDGSGGGTGGGPYRPGSGIEPPSLVREVKPDYPEDARRRSVEGDVVLEIVVRRDGSVGDVRVVQSLGGSLDQRAIAAVRQWRFDPAKRLGVPVDVLVEVSVEFKLR
jgi:TonB family protein